MMKVPFILLLLLLVIQHYAVTACTIYIMLTNERSGGVEVEIWPEDDRLCLSGRGSWLFLDENDEWDRFWCPGPSNRNGCQLLFEQGLPLSFPDSIGRGDCSWRMPLLECNQYYVFDNFRLTKVGGENVSARRPVYSTKSSKIPKGHRSKKSLKGAKSPKSRRLI